MSEANREKRCVVLDSSAMLALLNNEKGGPLVAALLADVGVTAYAHCVNLVEVFYDFGPQGSGQNLINAEKAMQALRRAKVIERSDLDGEFWRDVAFLIAERRSHPPRPEKPREKARLSLGDGFGLALARRLNAEFVTADRGEIEPLHERKLCRAVFLR